MHRKGLLQSMEFRHVAAFLEQPVPCMECMDVSVEGEGKHA